MIYRLDTKVIWDELHSQQCPVFICAFSHLDQFYSYTRAIHSYRLITAMLNFFI